MFSIALTMYSHGLGSLPAHSLSSDLIDLCGAAGVSEGDSMQCIAKGQVSELCPVDCTAAVTQGLGFCVVSRATSPFFGCPLLLSASTFYCSSPGSLCW
jgi:hypothetical protein